MTINKDDSERDKRLNQILLAYVEAVQEGRAPDRRRFLSDHPEFTVELREFLALRDQIDRLAAPLREVALASVSPKPMSEPRSPVPLAPFLEALKQDLGQPAAAASELGQVGEFRLLREIGRGGMGVVYEAHQNSLNRRVALKVLPFVAALDPKQLQRFQNEAQAAAQLHHTNIVPVYAVGCERGVHYYAMQFIEGQSLAAVIRELRQNAQGPRTNDQRMPNDQSPSTKEPGRGANAQTAIRHSTLDILWSLGIGRSSFFRTVAQLGLKAAEALEHAHELGVVHRDIKPANLLVDVRGNLWITDFGLALFQSGTALTLTGELVGTLRYMSPEQAWAKRGQVDHRTDIYSLGVTLYELLTLRPAFDSQDRQELVQQIAFEEPRAPRGIDTAIPVELETIVLKATAKGPAERYVTARDMADDLQRFLEDKPILAKRPSLRERTVKWARRHRSLVNSALALMFITMIGALISTIIIAREHAETKAAYDREILKAQEADEQRARAQDNFRRAREAVDHLAQIGEEELAGNQELEVLRWRLLEAALTYYQDFIDQSRDDPTIQNEFGASRAKITTILGQLITLIRSYQYIPLHEKEVQDELQLSDPQRQAIARMRKNWGDRSREAMRRGPGERERQRLELARDQEDKVAQLLSPVQLRRFKQIALQFIGPIAFSDPQVVEALGLTTNQKRQLRAILDQAGSAATKFGPHGGGPRRRSDDDAERRVQERILGVLTTEQRQKWDKLTGERFRFALP
jgi:serine/threonine protein kinase